MKNQALFSSKDKSKKLKCCLLQFLFGALRVKKGKRDTFPYFSVKHLVTSHWNHLAQKIEMRGHNNVFMENYRNDSLNPTYLELWFFFKYVALKILY